MGYDIHRCEQCHQSFWVKNCKTSLFDDNCPPAGMPQGYGARFCSKGCLKTWCQENPGKSPYTFGERILRGIVLFPILVPWWFCKMFFKILAKFAKNKWVWTICTCGMSWATWKLLDKVYGKK